MGPRVICITEQEAEYLKETFKSALAELDELVRTNEWYVTKVTDQIESSLEILEQKV